MLEDVEVRQMTTHDVQYIKERVIPRQNMSPLITADNTRFASVGAYRNPETQCGNVIRSAETFGIPITWLSWGEKWQGFNHHKLRVLQQQFPEWMANGIKYLFMLDSKDVVFADNLDTVLRKAADIYEPGTLLFNAEFDHHHYPYKDEHFTAVLKRDGVMLNSGLIFGSIDVFDAVITLALEIMDGIKANKPRPGIATHFCHDAWAREQMVEDDQLTYQLCSIYYPQYFRIDVDRYLLTWVRTLRGEPLDELRREPIKSGCIGQASIIHSSSTIAWAGQGVWDKWVQDNRLV
jgi:hypothetical protein